VGSLGLEDYKIGKFENARRPALALCRDRRFLFKDAAWRKRQLYVELFGFLLENPRRILGVATTQHGLVFSLFNVRHDTHAVSGANIRVEMRII